jgi:hypothetical protein
LRIAHLFEKAKKGTGMALVTTAAAAAAGYVIDELTGQITKDTTTTSFPDGYVDGIFWNITSGYSGETGYGQTASKACSQIGGDLEAPTKCNYAEGGYGVVSQGNCGGNTSWWFCQSPDMETHTQKLPVTASDMSEPIWDSLKDLPPDHSFWPELFKNDDGSWDVTTDDVEEFQDNLADWTVGQEHWDWDNTRKKLLYKDPNTGVSSEIGTDIKQAPTPETTNITNETSVTTTNNSDGSTSISNTTTNSETKVEFPVFCTWAVYVCDFIDWVKEEPELPEIQELPTKEIIAADFEKDFHSGIGSGSCPAPRSTSYQGQSIEYRFDTACMVAETYIYPTLITIAGIMAVMIISGVGFSRKTD